jgi:hypothetical protein
MSYHVRILADSIAPNGVRLTTMEWTYPRPIHSELLTHRAASRNAASSRAIPAKKLRNMVITEPFVPLEWLREQPGMVGGPALIGNDALVADAIWLDARDYMVKAAEDLSALGIHKSIPNRLIEPFMWITVLITATDWNNLWHLRVAKDAEQHFQHIARWAKEIYDHPLNPPQHIDPNDPCPWHLPLISWDDREDWSRGERTCAECKGEGVIDLCDEGNSDAWSCRTCNGTGTVTFTTMDLVKVSVGRCARVSYLTHDGRRDLGEDIVLHDRLLKDRHMSPFEHVATPNPYPIKSSHSGNFRGWEQYRKTFVDEYVPG